MATLINENGKAGVRQVTRPLDDRLETKTLENEPVLVVPIKSEPTVAPAKKRPIKRLIMGAALLAALVVGAKYGWSYWKWAAVHESTDDAFIDAHITQVSPRVAGHVARVYMNDNQIVHAGDVLADLDPADYQAQLDAANGKLAAARADLTAAESGVDQAQAQVSATEAGVAQYAAQAVARQAEDDKAKSDLQQYEGARKTGVVSELEWTKAQTTLKTADAALDASKKTVIAVNALVAQAEASLKSAQGKVDVAKAEIVTAQATVETATLNLSYTHIIASEDGRVTRKNLEPGNFVSPGTPLMALVGNDVWVTANFKETQLAQMKAGQSVDVSVDAYPGVKFTGIVDSIQSGSGARFSLLPPENATGNYVKVVQRVPVKILLKNPDPKYLLGPGMSAEPEVDVR